MGKRVLSTITCAAALSILSMACVPEVFAQDFKIGYVDPRLIVDRMPEAKAIQQRIRNLYERKQNELAGMQQELQTEIESYQQKVGVISEQARQQEEERLTLMDQEFRQLQSEAEQELQQKRAEFMEPLLQQIQNSVNDVAAQQELDLVINITTSGYGILDRTIIQISPELAAEYNITQKVIEHLGL